MSDGVSGALQLAASTPDGQERRTLQVEKLAIRNTLLINFFLISNL